MLRRCYWAYSPESARPDATPWAIQFDTRLRADTLHCLELDCYIYCEQAFGHAWAETITDVIVTDAEQTAALLWFKLLNAGAIIDNADYQAILLTIYEIMERVQHYVR